jgi:membrane-bound lytic murein transglycosylase D
VLDASAPPSATPGAEAGAGDAPKSGQATSPTFRPEVPTQRASGGQAADPDAPIVGTEAAPTVESVDSAEPRPAQQDDLWDRWRSLPAMPILDNDAVRRWEQQYLERPDALKRRLERAGRYLYFIVEEVSRRGLPAELALLPFVESSFNPHAVSGAKASGIWQFMPATGRAFDLRQNLFRDDRRSVLDSTRAALDYLAQLNDLFGDWHLALAAYNWGQGNLSRAIGQAKRDSREPRYENLSMPDETRQYVPKLQAIVNLVRDPHRHGLTLPPLQNHPYFLTVDIRRDIDVDLAIELAGLPADEFRALNPQMNKPVILAAGTPQLLLPFDHARRFQKALAARSGPLATWTAWVAPRTLRTADAARLVGMDEKTLRQINRIPPRMRVQAGSTLLVRRGKATNQDVSEKLADTAQIALSPDRPPGRRKTVKVGNKGESVAALARRHRLDAVQVASWNNVSPTTVFKGGQRVVLYVANAPKKKTSRPARDKSPQQAKGKATKQPTSQAAHAGRSSASRDRRG